MGENKALLPNAQGSNDTLLGCACELGLRILTEIGQDEASVFVSGLYPRYKCISDIVPGFGPLSGIHAALGFFLNTRSGINGLDYALFDYALFVPVDMPALKSDVLAELIRSRCDSLAGECRAVHFEGFELPALIRIEHNTEKLLLRKLTAPIKESTELSVKAFLQELCACKIELDSRCHAQFLNVNTPAQYAHWGMESRHEY